ncbi:hypothetical protein TNCV_1078931 [Trichonephila clavipes]|nr:hypothetical protein TNCV_1078931 [Trichonephila clavipes]
MTREEKIKPWDLTHQKCNDLCSKTHDCEEMVIKRRIYLQPYQVMDQNYDIECTPAKCFFHDPVKHGCGHHDTANKIWVHQKG